MTTDDARVRVLQFFGMSNELDRGAFTIADAATDLGQDLDQATVYGALQALGADGLVEFDPPGAAVTGLTLVRITSRGEAALARRDRATGGAVGGVEDAV